MASILIVILRICSSLFKYNYLKNEKYFLKSLFRLWNLHLILIIFEKKMIVIAYVFPKFQAAKDLLKPLSWKCRFGASLDSQHVNGCQTLVKSTWEHFYHIFWPLLGEMIWKMSPLLKLEILRVFLNTLTADEEYPVRNCEILHFPIQMQLN